MAPTASSAELWEELEKEIETATSFRSTGVRLCEDFAVETLSQSLARLKKHHSDSLTAAGGASTPGQDGTRSGAANARVEELVSLRVDLASDEQRLRTQLARIDEVRQQMQQARKARADLEQQLEHERDCRRRASEAHLLQCREAAYKQHLCQSKLGATEQETLQLQLAIGRPESLGTVWESLVKRLESELSAASVEAADKKKDLDRISADVTQAEREVERMRRPSEAAPSLVASAGGDRDRPQMTRDLEAARAEVARIASRSMDVSAAAGVGATGANNGSGFRSKRGSLAGTQASTRESSVSRSGLGSTVAGSAALTTSSYSSAVPAAAATVEAVRSPPAAAPRLSQYGSANGTSYAGSPSPEARSPEAPHVLDEARIVLEKLEALKSQHTRVVHS